MKTLTMCCRNFLIILVAAFAVLAYSEFRLRAIIHHEITEIMVPILEPKPEVVKEIDTLDDYRPGILRRIRELERKVKQLQESP